MILKRIFLFIPAVLLAVSVAHSADRLPPLARQALHKAQVCINDAQYAEAAAFLRDYMKEAGETVPAQIYLMLGGAYHKSGDAKRAFETFREGLDVHPDAPLLTRNCAVSCYESGKYVEAGRLFEKAYALKIPPDSSLLFHAGSAYYSGEDYKRAAKVMGRLLSVEKEPKKDWIRLAIHAYLQAGQSKQAEAMLRKFLAANPTEAPYWELLAKLYLDKEEFEKGASALEICYRLRDPSSRELERLASIYTYANAPLLASAVLKRAHPGATDVEQAVRIALLYATAGRADKALQQLARFGDGDTPGQKKGRILYNARRFKEAEQVLREVVKRNPKAGESMYLLAMCAWEKRDWKKARDTFARLSGNKAFSRRVQAPLAVIDDIEAARREASE